MQKPGVMATLNLFLETPATPGAELPPIRSKARLLARAGATAVPPEWLHGLLLWLCMLGSRG